MAPCDANVSIKEPGETKDGQQPLHRCGLPGVTLSKGKVELGNARSLFDTSFV